MTPPLLGGLLINKIRPNNHFPNLVTPSSSTGFHFFCPRLMLLAFTRSSGNTVSRFSMYRRFLVLRTWTNALQSGRTYSGNHGTTLTCTLHHRAAPKLTMFLLSSGMKYTFSSIWGLPLRQMNTLLPRPWTSTTYPSPNRIIPLMLVSQFTDYILIPWHVIASTCFKVPKLTIVALSSP